MTLPEHWQTTGPGVFRDLRTVVQVGDSHVAFLKNELVSSPAGRVRVCAHASNDSAVHEMVIALAPTTYVRPHRHVGKSESFHMISGLIDVVLFSPEDEITEIISLAPYGHGRPFYYRLSSDTFHTVIVQGESAVFHETTNGPFRREETVFAHWAPDSDSSTAVESYQQSLHLRVAVWKTNHLS